MSNKFLFIIIIIFNLFILYFALDINILKASMIILINIVFIYFMKIITNYIYNKYLIKKRNIDSDVNAIKEEEEHFIFSTLNTLNYFCRKDVIISRALVLALSNYLRLIFNTSDFVRGDELLNALKAYAYVQSVRLDKNIEFKYNDSLEIYKLKRTPIQDIVETLLSFIRKNDIDESLVDLDFLEERNNLIIYIKLIIPMKHKDKIESLNVFSEHREANTENLVYKIYMDKCFGNE